MKKIVRLNERDLTKLVKRVVNEGIINQLTPEELSQKYPNTNGTFTIKDGYFEVNMADGKRFGIYSARN
jgi:hypothetical protein